METTDAVETTETTEHIVATKRLTRPGFSKLPKLFIFITQLSETGNQLYFEKGSIPIETLQKAGEELGIQCIIDNEWR